MQIEKVMEFVLPFKNKLFRLALRMVGNIHEAEDIVQEVLIKVWKKRTQFFEIQNKEAWCMTITRNLTIDKIRAKKLNTSDITEHFNITDKKASPYKSLESNDRMKIIMGFINELPAKQMEVVGLRDIEGYSYKEISEITGFKVEQVKVYLHRARITLRAKILKNNLK